MSWNYPGAPGQYGQPPSFAPGTGSAPGGPPGMAPPGVGLHQDQGQPPNFPGMPSTFKAPPNMPNINFNAPVIRLGTSGAPAGGPPDNRGRADRNQDGDNRRRGLGMDRGGDNNRQQRDGLQMMPPTREEIFRTIFVGNIPEGLGGDAGVERLLRCVGNLRRWTRAIDADNKACSFGFAEYEDAESLETAAEVLKEVSVPTMKVEPKPEGDEAVEVARSTLLVVVDPASQKYAEEWHGKRQEDETTTQFRLDTARESLKAFITSLFNPVVKTTEPAVDVTMQNGGQQESTADEFIPLNVAEPEDELSEIPAEMRETVAAEIAAFRDRSNRRDLERLRREEEIEREEKEKSRLATTIPTGPGKGANGVPVGPADRGVSGAPTGPKGARGHQMPRDYQSNVAFVNGSETGRFTYITKEEQESDASDDELERRRRDVKDTEAEKVYADYERQWLIRERNRTMAIEREERRVEDERKNFQKRRENMTKRMKEWNETTERARGELYFADHSAWARQRHAARSRELQSDDADRRAEENEKARLREKDERMNNRGEQSQVPQTNGSTTAGASAASQPQKLKLSLGMGAAAQQKAQPAAPKRRTAFEVEGLLDDEEGGANGAKRTLIPIKFDSAAEAASLTIEERQEAARQLAADIPSSKDGLWAWKVHWDSVTDEVISEQLKPFVEKKIVEYLGVQEDMLVDVVEEHIRARKGPQELVDELEGPLDEEAEVLVKKLWRMVIFFSESERKGLAT